MVAVWKIPEGDLRDIKLPTRIKSARTHTLTIQNLIRLRDKFQDLDIYDSEEAFTMISESDWKWSTITTYLSAIINLVRTRPQEKKLMKEYQRMLREAKAQADSEATGMTANQAKAFRSWKEVLQIRDALTENMETDRLKAFDHLVLCLYTMIPPLRDDFRDMEFTTKRLGNATSTNWYYLSESGDEDEIILNQYKTKRSYGQQRRRTGPELAKVVRDYQRNLTGTTDVSHWHYVVPALKGAFNSPAEDGVKRSLERSLGKGGGCSLLRKIAITEWTTSGLPGIDKLAKNMCHSISVQQTSYMLAPKQENNSLGMFLT